MKKLLLVILLFALIALAALYIKNTPSEEFIKEAPITSPVVEEDVLPDDIDTSETAETAEDILSEEEIAEDDTTDLFTIDGYETKVKYTGGIEEVTFSPIYDQINSGVSKVSLTNHKPVSISKEAWIETGFELARLHRLKLEYNAKLGENKDLWYQEKNYKGEMRIYDISSDGKWFAYSLRNDDEHTLFSAEIFIGTTNGKTVLQLTDTPNIKEIEIYFFPDMSGVLYMTLGNEGYQLFTADFVVE